VPVVRESYRNGHTIHDDERKLVDKSGVSGVTLAIPVPGLLPHFARGMEDAVPDFQALSEIIQS
jgi:hypothetical protein